MNWSDVHADDFVICTHCGDGGMLRGTVAAVTELGFAMISGEQHAKAEWKLLGHAPVAPTSSAAALGGPEPMEAYQERRRSATRATRAKLLRYMQAQPGEHRVCDLALFAKRSLSDVSRHMMALAAEGEIVRGHYGKYAAVPQTTEASPA